MLYRGVANEHAAGQRLLCFSLNQEFLRSIDAARGHKTRSQFVREAVFQIVKEMGIRVNPDVIHPPDRARLIRFGRTEHDRNWRTIAAQSLRKHRPKKQRKKELNN